MKEKLRFLEHTFGYDGTNGIEEEILECPHLEYCSVKVMMESCIKFQECETWQWYNQYGEYYNSLGVGTKI